VDDHDLIRAGITRMLQDHPDIDVIGEADSGEQAIESTRRMSPDVVLMDMKMPGIGGMEATRRILQSADGVKVVIVSAMTENAAASRILQEGAAAYVSKNSHISEIINAINKVHRGQRYVSSDVAQSMALDEQNSGPFDTLSSREMQIATMIIECQKVQDISDALCLSPKTVNSYRYRIFEKLGISSDVELTLHAVKHGVLEVDGPK